MKLKVGDRVWRGNDDNPKRFLDTVIRLTPQFIYLESFGRNGTWYRSTGYPRGRATYFIIGIATQKEIAAWEAKQAREKAAQDARNALARANHLERCERAARLERVLNVGAIERVEDRIEFVFEGSRYRVTDLGPNA